mmetsp:Transcript_32134/g.61849  ORF Transcript_32134/g.61849 Transcript_32134/m.61849 type:complete len:111 (-) Transcript_32134:877-1209(-)
MSKMQQDVCNLDKIQQKNAKSQMHEPSTLFRYHGCFLLRLRPFLMSFIESPYVRQHKPAPKPVIRMKWTAYTNIASRCGCCQQVQAASGYDVLNDVHGLTCPRLLTLQSR